MKKNINKTIFAFLIFNILAMSKGFCFQDLLSSNLKINAAQAETMELNQIADNTGVCSDSSINLNADKLTNIWSDQSDNVFSDIRYLDYNSAIPVSGHHNSLLPCCLDENHPALFFSTNSVDLEKFIPQSIINNEQIQFSLPDSTNYQNPISAPPELYSIQKTILRL